MPNRVPCVPRFPRVAFRSATLLLLLCWLALLPRASAEGGAESWLWGPEFNFTKPGLGGNKQRHHDLTDEIEKLEKLVPRLRQRLREQGIRHSVEETTDDHGPVYRFRFEDGFTIDFAVDDRAIEIKTAASTRQAFIDHAPLMDKAVFGFLRDEGFEPDTAPSGLHINLDIERLFGRSPLLLRNFLVDLANHPELGNGAWGSDVVNAPTLADLGKRRRRAFAKLIADFDSGKIATSRELIRDLNFIIYKSTTTRKPGMKIGFNRFEAARHAQHYQGIGFPLWGPSDGRAELRYFRGVKNYREYLDYLELLEKRLLYLSRLTAPLVFENRDNIGSIQEGVNRYHHYVVESDLPYERYRQYLPDPWQVLVPGARAPLVPWMRCRRYFSLLYWRVVPLGD